MDAILNAMEAGTDFLVTTPFAVPLFIGALVCGSFAMSLWIFGARDPLDVEEMLK